MKWIRANALAGGCCLGLAVVTARAATPLTTERVATGLARPLFVTAPPGDTERLFIVEQKTGVIKILNLNSQELNSNGFLTVTGMGTTANEQGLLGLAFHPNYDGNGLFYVNYTDTAGDTVVARYARLTEDLADAASRDILLTFDQTQINHNGGWLGFGPDGYLYIATGDGGGGGDDDSGHTAGLGNGQDITDNLLGKMLRLDVDGDDFPGDPDRDYVIPPTNPFVGANGDDEIWAFGLRNPWRDSFDRLTGDLWIADVGQNDWEEINFQPAGTNGGRNYGWRCREGKHNFNTNGDCTQTPFTEPIHEYDHDDGCSITGGYVYRGCAIPDLRGTYFFGDYCSNTIWSFRYDGSRIAEFQDRTAELAPPAAQGTINWISSFGEDGFGELYICDHFGGELFKIVPDGPAVPPTPHDYDADGDVDLIDLARFVECLGGPDVTFSDCPCVVFDEHTDGHVDLRDFTGFQSAFTG